MRRFRVKGSPRIKSTPKIVDGILFQSQLEAKYYTNLKLRVQSGEILFFLRQVPFQLPGNIKYFVDFQEFHSNGEIHFIDVKGFETEIFTIKKAQVEDLYPVEIEIVKKKDIS